MPVSIPVYFLIAAALLGFVIGWFFNRIWAIKFHNKVVNDGESQLRRLNRRIRVMTDDNNLLESRLKQTETKLKSIQENASNSAGKLDAQLEEKTRQIEELESKAYASEEQYMRLQRDYAKFKLVKTREVLQLQQQLVAVGGTATIVSQRDESSDVPVLNKKANIDAISDAELSAAALPDVTHEVLESEEDLMDMTSEFNFDPEELLADD